MLVKFIKTLGRFSTDLCFFVFFVVVVVFFFFFCFCFFFFVFLFCFFFFFCDIVASRCGAIFKFCPVHFLIVVVNHNVSKQFI